MLTLIPPEPWLPASFWQGAVFGMSLTLLLSLLVLLWWLSRKAGDADGENQYHRAHQDAPQDHRDPYQ